MFREQINNSDYRLKILEEVRGLLDKGKELYIYGTAASALCVTDYLKDYGVNEDIHYVVDAAYMNGKHAVPSNKIFSFDKYLKEYAVDSVLIFGFHNYMKACKIMKTYQKQVPHMYFIQLQEINGKQLLWTYDRVMDQIEEFEACYRMLADERSKGTMVSYVNAAISGDLKQLFNLYRENNQYFNDITKDIRIDTYIDCGAYNGDSIREFIRFYGDYKKIIAMEPDPDNYKQIYAWRDSGKIKNLTVVEKGVFDATKTLYFSQDATSSYLCEDGEICVPVMRLDDLDLAEHKASLIKMDIEGSEMAALEGARKLIQRDAPALAICVYHKVEDLAEIPQYIDSMVGKGTYHYHLRHHGDNVTELVFYAIPQ